MNRPSEDMTVAEIEDVIKATGNRCTFLKTLGVATPAVLAGAPAGSPYRIAPGDVFEVYVSETLHHLQLRSVERLPDHVIKAVEAQGVGLAMVLAHFQGRGEP